MVHNWQNTQNDGWYRIALKNWKVPYTYVADTGCARTRTCAKSLMLILMPRWVAAGQRD